MPQKFSELPRPYIVCVLREKTILDTLATMNNAEYDGAHAFNLHLQCLDSKYVAPDPLRQIVTNTHRPMMMLNYRQSGEAPDEERVEAQLIGVRAGAMGLDMPADTFDPTPRERYDHIDVEHDEPLELTRNPSAIRKQREVITKVHDLGGEVMLSSHTRVVMSAERALAHAQEMREHGADIVKMVTVCRDDHELVEAFRTIVLFKEKLGVPFQYQCHGQHGKLTRVVGPMLGSILVYCNQEYRAQSFMEQPTVRAMAEVLRNTKWRLNENLTETSFLNT